MEQFTAKTLCDPGVERAFMETYYVEALEQHQLWCAMLRSLAEDARKRDLDGFVVYRELRRQMQREIDRADDAIGTLATMESRTWGGAQLLLESSWDALEQHWTFWTQCVH